jgi:succinate dehydrogenase / fumarate reductase cytochrome b subunit
VGRKYIAGLTGLGLVGFLCGHLFGNMNLLAGNDAMVAYAHKLHGLPGFALIELGLLGAFILHIVVVMSLVRDNLKARGSRYAQTGSKRGQFMAALASRTMAVSGVLLIGFLVVHVVQLRGRRAAIEASEATGGGIGVEVVALLSQPHWAMLYFIGAMLAGWHVYHGLQSAARSLGFHHRRYSPVIQLLGQVLGVVFAVGFGALAVMMGAGVLDAQGFSFMQWLAH